VNLTYKLTEKECRYLFAFALWFIVVWNSVDVSYKYDEYSDMQQINVATSKINPLIFAPSAIIIAVILGVPIEVLSLAFGKSTPAGDRRSKSEEEPFKEKAD